MADDYFLSGSTLQASTAVADGNGRRYVIPKIQLVDASGNYAGARGQTTSANSQSVVPATDSAPFPVVGNVAAGSADSGAPVKMGGRAAITLASVAEGTRGDLLLDGRGQLRVVLQTAQQTPVDTSTQAILSYPPGVASGQAYPIGALGYAWNGANVLPVRGDTNGLYNVAASSSAAAVGLTPITATNVSSLVVKASAGNFYGGTIVAGATAGFLIAYNAASAPASGAALTAAQILGVVQVAANGSAALGEYTVPDRFSTGVVLLFSTSTTTYTVPANNAAFLRGRAA